MGTRAKKLLEQWLKRLEAQLDLERLMQGCCQALLELTKADRCSIMVLDGDTEQLVVRWAQGARVKPYGRLRFRVGEGLCGWVARSQKPLFSFDVAKELRFIPSPLPGRHFRPVKAIFCLPLIIDGRTVGVLNLSSFSPARRFQWVERGVLKRFLDRLARVIAQATLLHEAQASSSRWRRLAKATSETVAQVSHEVRTPLTLITEGVQQLLDGYGGEPSHEQKQIITLVRNQSDRMLKLVTELLDLSRIEAGRLPLHRRPMDMAQVIQEVRSRYEPLVSPRKLHLALAEVPSLYGDRDRLAQVVENLLTNAVKFTPPEGSITIDLSAHGRSAEVSVSDTGIGINEREQRRLFEKFFQPKVPASFSARGTGLGLTIVKEIVQLHGGTIRVHSQPGEGTTFTVSLPLYSPPFALTEEFRVMREQAAREGLSLACQLLTSSNASFNWQEVRPLLERHISREDRVLENPGGGLLLFSISDPEGFKAMRKRLTEVLRSHQEMIPPAFKWGWVLVPQEGTELRDILALAKRRCEEGEEVLQRRRSSNG